MDSGVIAVNASGDISLFNAAAAKLTGMSAQTLKNESYQISSPLSQFPFKTPLTFKPPLYNSKPSYIRLTAAVCRLSAQLPLFDVDTEQSSEP